MKVVIRESEMQFGEYDKTQVFHMENSEQYTKKLRQNGIKSCEFVLMKGNKLYFVEAKKSCPNKILAESSKERKVKYNEFIQDIVTKMKHSLNLYANILLERYSIDEVPDAMRNLKNLDMRLVLIVKNAEIKWLMEYQNVFRKELQNEMRIWKIPDFMILNEDQARKKHFII